MQRRDAKRERIKLLEEALAMAASRFDDLALLIERDGGYQNAGFMTQSAKRCRQAIAGKSFDADLE